MQAQDRTATVPDVPAGHRKTESTTKSLLLDLEAFSDAIHDSKERWFIQTSQTFAIGNQHTLEQFLQTTNLNTSHVNGESIGKITRVFELLQQINEPIHFVEPADMDKLFSVIQCTLNIGLWLGQTIFDNKRIVIYPLEDLSLYLKIDELDLESVLLEDIWTTMATAASQIVRFCTTLIRCRPSKRIAFPQAPASELREIMKTLASNAERSRQRKELRAADEELRKKADEEETRKKNEEEQQLLDWLNGISGTTSTDRHPEVSKSRAKGTCSSFLKRTSKWLAAGKHPVLWAEGPPGVGKSVLASAFIDTMSDRIKEEAEINDSQATRSSFLNGDKGDFNPSALAYIYLAWDDRQTQYPVQVYARLLLQLFPRVKELREPLKSLKKDKGERPESLTLRKILQNLHDRVVIVIDALDEASPETSRDLSSLIKDIPQKGPHILVFSRPVSETPAEQKCEIIKVVSKDDDMTAYIMETLREHNDVIKVVQRRFGANTLEQYRFLSEIRKQILKRSGNMFLIATFRAKDVCAQRSIKNMRNAASRSDRDSTAIYTRTWQRISDSSNKEDVDLAKKVIGWLTFAKRPLDANELMEAVSIHPGVYEMDGDEKVYPESVEQLCRGLVVYDTQGIPKRLRLAHQTVQEHFAEHPEFQDMKKEICRSCFTYIIYVSDPHHDRTKARRGSLGNWSSDEGYSGDGYSDEGYAHDEILTHDSEHHFWGFPSPDNPPLGESNSDGATSPFQNSSAFEQLSICTDTDDLDFSADIWPDGLSSWCAKGYELSQYAGDFAMHHLSDIDIDEITRNLLRDFVVRLSSLRCVIGQRVCQHWGMKMLHLGVYVGDRQLVNDLFGQAQADIRAQDRSGRTALMWALHFDKCDLADLLLEKGSEANKLDMDDEAAIVYAEQCQDQAVIHKLLEQTEPNNYNDPMLLVSAAEAKNGVLVRALLERNVDPSNVHLAPLDYFLSRRASSKLRHLHGSNKCRCTALHVAVSGGCTGIVKMLLDAGADVSILDSHGHTPLWLSVRYEFETEFHMLLKERSELCNVGDAQGLTPLHLVVKTRWGTCAIEDMLRAGADPSATDEDGATPLMHALVNWSPYCNERNILFQVQKLATSATVVLKRTKRGMTALHCAAEHPMPHVMSRLVRVTRGQGLNDLDKRGKTAVCIAAENGHSKVVEVLLSYQDLNLVITYHEGATLLHLAIQHCSASCINAVICKDRSLLDRADTMGRSPLFTAVKYSRFDVFTCLLSAGADPTIANNHNENPFILACGSPDLRFVEALLGSETWLDTSKPGRPPQRNRLGETALHYAAMNGSTAMMEKLLKLPGLSPLDRDLSGDSALSIAVRDGRENEVDRGARVLLQHAPSSKALASALNNSGKSALDFALERGYAATIGVLVDPIHEACVGLPWDTSGDAIKQWDKQPWFGQLRTILNKPSASITHGPSRQWGVVKGHSKQALKVGQHGKQMPYVSVRVPYGARSPVRRITFVTVSHDQGWSDNNESNNRSRGTYFGSWTWFEAGLLKSGSCSTTDSRRTIQRNVHAKGDFSKHTNTWDFRDTTPGVREWLSNIQGGDQIQVIPRALFHGWVNYVREVEVTLYYERGSEDQVTSEPPSSDDPRGGREAQQKQHEGRLICYHQTHMFDDKHISLRPLVDQGSGITHVIIAAFHINEDHDAPTLNDDSPDHSRFRPLWEDMQYLQARNIKVLAMLGGAARGSFRRLDFATQSANLSPNEEYAKFKTYYNPLRTILQARSFDGIDLDVEEYMSLPGIVRLIDALRKDFGPTFLITLAPVATALQIRSFTSSPPLNLSGFDYTELEALRGAEIAWYNTQFYCGWSDLPNPDGYKAIENSGWDMRKVVIGLSTNPLDASGFIGIKEVELFITELVKNEQVQFGGLIGWEYFRALPGGQETPWQWAITMSGIIEAVFKVEKN